MCPRRRETVGQLTDRRCPDLPPNRPSAPDTRPMQLRRNCGTIPSLVLAARPLQGLLIALGVAFAALASGRDWREVGVVFAAVLIGRATFGWLNDVADRERDIAVERQDKVLVREWLHPGNPDLRHRGGRLLPGAGLDRQRHPRRARPPRLGARGQAVQHPDQDHPVVVPAVGGELRAAGPFLAYGGWGGSVHGSAPQPAMVVLAALLGVCIHVLDALPDLVEDNRNGVRSLPLVIALRTGGSRAAVGHRPPHRRHRRWPGRDGAHARAARLASRSHLAPVPLHSGA